MGNQAQNYKTSLPHQCGNCPLADLNAFTDG